MPEAARGQLRLPGTSATSLRQPRQLVRPITQQRSVHPLHTLRDRVIHVPHLVAPGAEAPPRVDVLLLEPRLHDAQHLVTLQRRRRIRVVALDEKRVDDVASIGLADHPGVDETLYGVL